MRWHSSACVSYESKSGKKILFDPWLSDLAFLGSWAPWPDPNRAREYVMSERWDYVVYTHFHSDHFDTGFLKEFLKNRNNSRTKFVLIKNSWPQLGFVLSAIARENEVLLLESGDTFFIDNDFSITLWESDFCDPTSCGKAIPCYNPINRMRSFDTAALINGDGFSVLNLNDAVGSGLATHLAKRGVKADLTMGVYGAAGSFPQCLDGLDESELNEKKSQFIDSALKRLVDSAVKVESKYIFPFAGQYILVGDLSVLNDKRAIQSLDISAKKLDSIFDGEIITLNTNEFLEAQNGEIVSTGSKYVEPTMQEKEAYLNNFRYTKYTYENLRESELVHEKTKNLSKTIESSINARYSEQSRRTNYGINVLSKQFGFVFSIDFYNKITVNTSAATGLNRNCSITLDSRLLHACLSRRRNYRGFTSMHWNQAHIGSHLRFNQTEYDELAHYFLNFFHI